MCVKVRERRRRSPPETASKHLGWHGGVRLTPRDQQHQSCPGCPGSRTKGSKTGGMSPQLGDSGNILPPKQKRNLKIQALLRRLDHLFCYQILFALFTSLPQRLERLTSWCLVKVLGTPKHFICLFQDRRISSYTQYKLFRFSSDLYL